MTDRAEDSQISWDPYEVWRTLILSNPDLLVQPAKDDPGDDLEMVKQFAMTISDFPDDLQDFLFVLAREYGVEAAHDALDEAVRVFYTSKKERSEKRPAEAERSPEISAKVSARVSKQPRN